MTKIIVLALSLAASMAVSRPAHLPEDQIVYSLGDAGLGSDLSGQLDRIQGLGVTTIAIPAEAKSEGLIAAAHARKLAIVGTDDLRASEDRRFAEAAIQVIGKGAGTNVLARAFRADSHHPGGTLRLHSFLSDPTVGPFALSIRKLMPRVSHEELQKRVMLAHAMLLTLRGIPVIGFGDERGIVSPGGVDPLYGGIAELARIRTTHAALRRGLQKIRYSSDKPGLLAVSRFEPRTGRETLLLFNTSTEPLQQDIRVETRSKAFDVVLGSCPLNAQRGGRVQVELPALGYSVCDAR